MNSKIEDPLLDEITRLEKVMSSMEAELDAMENDLDNGVDVDTKKIKMLLEQIKCAYTELDRCRSMHDNGGGDLLNSIFNGTKH